jgi:hypothetical protein
MILSLLPEGKRMRRRRKEARGEGECTKDSPEGGKWQDVLYCTYLTRFVSCWLRCSMYSEDCSCVSSGSSKSSM